MISFNIQKVRFRRPFHFYPVNRKIEWPRTKPKNGAYKRNFVRSECVHIKGIMSKNEWESNDSHSIKITEIIIRISFSHYKALILMELVISPTIYGGNWFFHLSKGCKIVFFVRRWIPWNEWRNEWTKISTYIWRSWS